MSFNLSSVYNEKISYIIQLSKELYNCTIIISYVTSRKKKSKSS